MTSKVLVVKGEEEPSSVAPIVIELGKTRRSRIKKLKKGQGGLMEDVQDVLAQVRASLGDRASGAQLIPVVLIYKQKPKRARFGLFGV